MKKQIFITLFFAFSLNLFLFSQKSEEGIKGVSTHHNKVSYQEILQYDIDNPPENIPKLKMPKNPSPQNLEIITEEGVPVFEEKINYYKLNQSHIKETSPAPDADFMALPSNYTSIPPDTYGAVGPNHLVTALNSEWRIQTKSGTTLSTNSWNSLWQGLPFAGNSFDPRVIYDPYEERWVMLEVTYNGSSLSSSYLLIAASENSDPTGNWYTYSIPAYGTNTWMDYPAIGFNKKWIVVTGNNFTLNSLFTGSSIYIINKESFYVGVPNIEYTKRPSSAASVSPAKTYDNDIEEVYCVFSRFGNSGGNGSIGLYKIHGDLNNPFYQFVSYIIVPDPWIKYINDDFAPQLGSSAKISNGDDRMSDVFYRDGSIWCAHNIFLPVSDPQRTAVQWFELNTNGSIIQRGRIEDQTNQMFYAYPSIAVNAIGETMIGFSAFSSDQYAAAAYSFRSADDPLGTMRDPYQFKDGEATYNLTYGGNSNRWGDYSGTMIDPNDDLDFWILQEYAKTPQNTWSTWWAYLNRETAPVSQLSVTNLADTLIPVGTSVDFTDLTLYSPSTWEWQFEGGNPATSTDQHPQNIVYATAGSFNVTLITSNAIGFDTVLYDDYITSSTDVIPEADFMASETFPCFGSTIVFTDNSIYHPYTWEWTFSPNDVTFENGTSSSSQNPEVNFGSADNYSVTLTVSNPNGNNSLTKTDYILYGGVLFPFHETFDDVSEENFLWTIENPDDLITWEQIDVAGNTPGNKAMHLNFNEYPGGGGSLGERDRLISPFLNITNIGETRAKLVFEHAYAQKAASTVDSLIVYVSDDCGGIWNKKLALGEDGSGNLATVSPSSINFIPASASDWCFDDGSCYEIDISEFLNSNSIQVMFESYYKYGNALFIDNVKVVFNTATDDIIYEDYIHITPNPSNGVFTIESNCFKGLTEITVLSLDGKIMMKSSINGNLVGFSKNIDISKFGKGIYLLNIKSSDFTKTKKVVVN